MTSFPNFIDQPHDSEGLSIQCRDGGSINNLPTSITINSTQSSMQPLYNKHTSIQNPNISPSRSQAPPILNPNTTFAFNNFQNLTRFELLLTISTKWVKTTYPNSRISTAHQVVVTPIPWVASLLQQLPITTNCKFNTITNSCNTAPECPPQLWLSLICYIQIPTEYQSQITSIPWATLTPALASKRQNLKGVCISFIRVSAVTECDHDDEGPRLSLSRHELSRALRRNGSFQELKEKGKVNNVHYIRSQSRKEGVRCVDCKCKVQGVKSKV